MRPNMGVVGGESWCFLMVLRAISAKPGEGKHCIQVQNNNSTSQKAK